MKKIILFLLLFLSIRANPVYAAGKDTPCSSSEFEYMIYATYPDDPNTPVTPTAGKEFELNFVSEKSIKAGQEMAFNIRTDNPYNIYQSVVYPQDNTSATGQVIVGAGVDGTIRYIPSNYKPLRKLQFPSGQYKIQILKPNRAEFLCVSDPFTVKAPGDIPPDEERCVTFKAEIKNKKIVLSGTVSSDKISGAFTPVISRSTGSTPLGTNRMPVGTDNKFGPTEYDLPINFPGGNFTIGLWHDTKGQLPGCQTTAEIPNTIKVTVCPPSIEEYEKHKYEGIYLKPEDCTSGGGKETPGCTDNKGNPGIGTAIGCIHTNPNELVKDFLTFGVGIGGGLAFLMMLLGAFQMLTSAGNPETLNAGKDRLTNAVIGLLFIIFAVLLLQITGVGILAIPGFS